MGRNRGNASKNSPGVTFIEVTELPSVPPRVGGTEGVEVGSFPNSVFSLQNAKSQKFECPKLPPRSNNCAKVGLEGQRITDNQFVISLNVNGMLVDGYRNLGNDISLDIRKIVEMGIIFQIRV